TNLAAQNADTVVINATGGSAAPTAVAMPTCTSGADLYNTSTHTWSCVSVGGNPNVPGWLNYYGDGSDGALSYSSNNSINAGVYNATTWACTGTTVLSTGTDIPLIVRATTSITIGANCTLNAADLNDIKGTFGGGGGAGGGGTAASTAATGAYGYNTGAIAAVTAGGGASATNGGTGPSGAALATKTQRSAVADGPIFPESNSTCGGNGSAGGSSGGTYGLGGGCIFLVAPTITIASGAKFNAYGGRGTVDWLHRFWRRLGGVLRRDTSATFVCG